MSEQARLSDLLLDACHAFGGAIACEDARDTISYAALGVRTAAIVDALHRAGLDHDELVLVLVSNQASDIAVFTAVWRAGGVVVCMVELVGRSKELIVRGGTKVSPLELDELLESHPSVAAALTVGIPDPVLGERIHALIVLRKHEEIDEAVLRQWVSERVEKFKRPDFYHFGSSLPTGRTGKVDRTALREQITRAASSV